MVKYLFGWSILLFFLGCQSETSTATKDINAGPINADQQSGTVADVTVPLIFLLKESRMLNTSGRIEIRDTAFFRSLPVGVYPVVNDTILFGKIPGQWVWSGVMRWPEGERVALADFTIISDKPLSDQKIGIFPQQPGEDGYLPGCFSGPEWMDEKYGELAVFWENYAQ